GVGVIRSDDGGLHWSSAQNIDDVLQNHDTPWIVVDNGPAPGQPLANHHPGRVYAVWTLAAPAPGEPVASYSDGFGANGTWQKVPSPIGVSAEGATLGFDDKAVVLSNGDLGIFFDTGH